MKVVTGLDTLVGKYVSERTGVSVTDTPYIGFAVKNSQDEFVAGIVVSNYRLTDCEVSMAAETPNWARKQVMRTIFEYIFNTMGCVRCTCIVKNERASRRTRRFLQGIGFALEGNLRRAYDGHHGALIYGLLAEDCQFLGDFHGQKVRTGTASRARSSCDGASADAI